MLKNENGQTKHNVICTDIVDRVSGIRMNSLRPSKEKKDETINRFWDFRICTLVCVCVSTALYWISLCVAHCRVYASSRTKLARKNVFGLSPCPPVFVSRSRRETALIEMVVESQWSTCQYHTQLVIDNFDIYAFCLHDSKPTATSRPTTTTISNERSGTVQLAMTVTETAGISVHFFSLFFLVSLNDHMISFISSHSLAHF